MAGGVSFRSVTGGNLLLSSPLLGGVRPGFATLKSLKLPTTDTPAKNADKRRPGRLSFTVRNISA